MPPYTWSNRFEIATKRLSVKFCIESDIRFWKVRNGQIWGLMCRPPFQVKSIKYCTEDPVSASNHMITRSNLVMLFCWIFSWTNHKMNYFITCKRIRLRKATRIVLFTIKFTIPDFLERISWFWDIYHCYPSMVDSTRTVFGSKQIYYQNIWLIGSIK